MPLREWRLRIEDILAALEKIRQYTARTSLEQFRSNSMAVEAVLYNLMIIGEAARFVPNEIVERHPTIDWNKMRAMRNIMVHEYFGADLGIVWQTLQTDLPPLVRELRGILERER